MKKKISDIRIGKRFISHSGEIWYGLEFRFENEKRFNGYSLGIFSKRVDAINAMNKHISGEEVYEPYTSFGVNTKKWWCWCNPKK